MNHVTVCYQRSRPVDLPLIPGNIKDFDVFICQPDEDSVKNLRVYKKLMYLTTVTMPVLDAGFLNWQRLSRPEGKNMYLYFPADEQLDQIAFHEDQIG